MAIDPAQNKALRKTSASDSEWLWKLLPRKGPVRSAHEYQCTSRGASGTAWYLAGSPAPSRSSSTAADAEGVIRSPGR
ncbi:hypothetical protein CapIbe_008177 [Capra ibex]